jgi:hypothetical protein
MKSTSFNITQSQRDIYPQSKKNITIQQCYSYAPMRPQKRISLEARVDAVEVSCNDWAVHEFANNGYWIAKTTLSCGEDH